MAPRGRNMKLIPRRRGLTSFVSSVLLVLLVSDISSPYYSSNYLYSTLVADARSLLKNSDLPPNNDEVTTASSVLYSVNEEVLDVRHEAAVMQSWKLESRSSPNFQESMSPSYLERRRKLKQKKRDKPAQPPPTTLPVEDESTPGSESSKEGLSDATVHLDDMQPERVKEGEGEDDAASTTEQGSSGAPRSRVTDERTLVKAPSTSEEEGGLPEDAAEAVSTAKGPLSRSRASPSLEEPTEESTASQEPAEEVEGEVEGVSKSSALPSSASDLPEESATSAADNEAIPTADATGVLNEASTDSALGAATEGGSERGTPPTPLATSELTVADTTLEGDDLSEPSTEPLTRPSTSGRATKRPLSTMDALEEAAEEEEGPRIEPKDEKSAPAAGLAGPLSAKSKSDELLVEKRERAASPVPETDSGTSQQEGEEEEVPLPAAVGIKDVPAWKMPGSAEPSSGQKGGKAARTPTPEDVEEVAESATPVGTEGTEEEIGLLSNATNIDVDAAEGRSGTPVLPAGNEVKDAKVDEDESPVSVASVKEGGEREEEGEEASGEQQGGIEEEGESGALPATNRHASFKSKEGAEATVEEEETAGGVKASGQTTAGRKPKRGAPDADVPTEEGEVETETSPADETMTASAAKKSPTSGKTRTSTAAPVALPDADSDATPTGIPREDDADVAGDVAGTETQAQPSEETDEASASAGQSWRSGGEVAGEPPPSDDAVNTVEEEAAGLRPTNRQPSPKATEESEEGEIEETEEGATKTATQTATEKGKAAVDTAKKSGKGGKIPAKGPVEGGEEEEVGGGVGGSPPIVTGKHELVPAEEEKGEEGEEQLPPKQSSSTERTPVRDPFDDPPENAPATGGGPAVPLSYVLKDLDGRSPASGPQFDLIVTSLVTGQVLEVTVDTPSYVEASTVQFKLKAGRSQTVHVSVEAPKSGVEGKPAIVLHYFGGSVEIPLSAAMLGIGPSLNPTSATASASSTRGTPPLSGLTPTSRTEPTNPSSAFEAGEGEGNPWTEAPDKGPGMADKGEMGGPAGGEGELPDGENSPDGVSATFPQTKGQSPPPRQSGQPTGSTAAEEEAEREEDFGRGSEPSGPKGGSDSKYGQKESADGGGQDLPEEGEGPERASTKPSGTEDADETTDQPYADGKRGGAPESTSSTVDPTEPSQGEAPVEGEESESEDGDEPKAVAVQPGVGEGLQTPFLESFFAPILALFGLASAQVILYGFLGVAVVLVVAVAACCWCCTRRSRHVGGVAYQELELNPKDEEKGAAKKGMDLSIAFGQGGGGGGGAPRGGGRGRFTSEGKWDDTWDEDWEEAEKTRKKPEERSLLGSESGMKVGSPKYGEAGTGIVSDEGDSSASQQPQASSTGLSGVRRGTATGGSSSSVGGSKGPGSPTIAKKKATTSKLVVSKGKGGGGLTGGDDGWMKEWDSK
eukprot:TRINITY_DN3779_c0_g1_i1.p1 TRINITY_DN3779_c0_g1~~TRINITY_DN3779_c0_g1_i1.p1  ORF type:complete len:1434 (+),score=358.52 TRINITY_DN3779_c0_g1_i1:149-4450(+)